MQSDREAESGRGAGAAGAARVPELPCVWVTAGVLSYRPCDRGFECEECPLYHALRGESAEAPGPAAGGDDAVGRYLTALGAGCPLHLDRACSAEGLWMEAAPAGELRFGFDEFTLRLLQPVDGIVLPRVGVRLRHGAHCAWVNRGRGRDAISLRTPIAGEVVAVHPDPAVRPPAAGTSGGVESASERWWFVLRPLEPVAAAEVLRNEALLGWCLARVRTVRRHLDALVGGAGVAVGPVLADGGRAADDLEAVLGRERFDALVAALFPMHI